MDQAEPPRYKPQDHIQRLEVSPPIGGMLDHREITIQSYQTTVPFDESSVRTKLEAAWLSPQTRFGVYSDFDSDKPGVHVLLGLQEDMKIRAYDYDGRQPLWYAWQGAIVDIVKLGYSRDRDGFLQFRTSGGGPRITQKRLHQFNTAFQGIPEQHVQKQQFDLSRLRDLCFQQFADRLYKLRFSHPAAKGYRTIDQASFKSRKYIDPKAARLKEILTDSQVMIESFESDIDVQIDEWDLLVTVRFLFQGRNGSLRLNFPKIPRHRRLRSFRDEAAVFFRLVDATAATLLDANESLYARRTLDGLSTNLPLFPEMVNLKPFREALMLPENRKKFLSEIDLGAPWRQWKPHLEALDTLLSSESVAADVDQLLTVLISRDPLMSARLLLVCQQNSRLHQLGHRVAARLGAELQAIDPQSRVHAEESLLSWAIDRERVSWDVHPERGIFTALTPRWRIEDIAFDVLPKVLWKLVGVLHARLMNSTDDVGPLLEKYHWCIAAVRCLPPHHSQCTAALRLVAEKRVPKTVNEADEILKQPVHDFRALDAALLSQFGLPLWPRLTAARRDDKLELSNDGIGAALSVTIHSATAPSGRDERVAANDVRADESVAFPWREASSAVDVHFEKFGRTYRTTVPIGVGPGSTSPSRNLRALTGSMDRSRRRSQRKIREKIDPEGLVVGSSPALLAVFEQIHYANLTDGLPPVLLLGESGVGKTHIAKLIHQASPRKGRPFAAVNAGGGGGDTNIQRGEWIGYGKGHGIHGIAKGGQPGHLMKTDGGTLFIDEFASLSDDLQTIFLSVLDNGSIEKVGGESFKPDVRCILATNADLETEVRKGRLRRDLLARIPIRISIPPLRERSGDILSLVRQFAEGQQISDQALLALLRYDWPDNIREVGSKVSTARGRANAERRATLSVDHFELPAALVASVEDLDADACRRELWTMADAIAQCEGLKRSTGLQRRAGEILGVTDGQATKMYRAFGLGQVPSA